MRISDVLRVKGTQVITPDTKVRHLLAVVAEHRDGQVRMLTWLCCLRQCRSSRR